MKQAFRGFCKTHEKKASDSLFLTFSGTYVPKFSTSEVSLKVHRVFFDVLLPGLVIYLRK